MKRMVENSEKIEKLLDDVYVDTDGIYFNKEAVLDYGLYSGAESHFDDVVEFNDEVITSNITTKNDDRLYIFKSNDYSISSDFPGIVNVINLGTALLIKATINSGTPTNSYNILTINRDYQEFDSFQISDGMEFIAGIESDEGEFMLTTEFDETKADHTRPKYTLIFLIGHNGVQS